jgi:Cellulase (glycosyl hydrolase family 5)
MAAAALVTACGGDGGTGRPAPNAPWSIIEDHTPLIRSGASTRAKTLQEMRGLGADTLRLSVKWNEVAPGADQTRRPSFDPTDPKQYPGFGPYDDVVRRASAKGMRLLLVLAPDAPRWATSDHAPLGTATGNREPDPRQFARFAAAVGKRYSGDFEGLPKVEWFSLWNEPNHYFFLKPNDEAPRIYRAMVAAALPALRDAASEDAAILVGETAPLRRPGTVLGPRDFLRRWLCLDDEFRPTPDEPGCRDFRGFEVDGYAHHPYGPTSRTPKHADIVSMLVIRRLGEYLDLAAAARRLPRSLPIYNTEFGLQSNPPDPTARLDLEQQAALLNEKEEQSYRYTRVRSYAQYLLYDDPPREGATEKEIWSGFQTGLRFTDGATKPAWRAYRLSIVVERVETGVRIWGHVRTFDRDEVHHVAVERRTDAKWLPASSDITPDDAGYFSVRLTRRGEYRYRVYFKGRSGSAVSRAANPVRATPLED